MSLNAPADAANGAAGVAYTPGSELAKTPEKEKSKQKKRKRDAETEANATEPEAADGHDAESPAVVKSKKVRKGKKNKEHKESKKSKKKALQKGIASTQAKPEDANASVEPSPKKPKKNKDKYNKNKNKNKDVAPDSEAVGKFLAAGPAKTTDNWNVSALEGGSERQSKFMKLLGGGKAASSPGAKGSGGAHSKMDVHKYQDDLQKQYDTGMRMKFEGQGQRRGLGA